MITKLCILSLALSAAAVAYGGDESLKVQLSVAVKQVYPGEPVMCTVTLRNAGKETIRYFPLHGGWVVSYKGVGGEKELRPDRFPAAEGEFMDEVVHFQAGRQIRWAASLSGEMRMLSGQPGVYRLQFVQGSDGKARVGRLTLQELQGIKKAEDGIDGSVNGDDELKKASPDDSFGIVEINCWAGKIASNVVEVELKALESKEDKAAFNILANGGTEISWPGSYYEHIQRLRKVLKECPGSVYAKYCTFYLAEALASNGEDVEPVIPLYKKVIDEYPAFQLSADAKLRIAQRCLDQPRLRRAGGEEKAKALLEDIVKTYAESVAADQARGLLAKIAKEARTPRAAGTQPSATQVDHHDKGPREAGQNP